MLATWLCSVEAVDELLAGVEATLDLEREHRAVALAAADSLGALVPRARGEAGVVDRFDLGVAVEDSATVWAFDQWRSMRRLSVSMP